MIENRKIQLAEVPIGGEAGFIWTRLHGQREDICEALLKPCEPGSRAQQRKQLLQQRLQRIDDALDRLMSSFDGSNRARRGQ